jgi:hypothetical protein
MYLHDLPVKKSTTLSHVLSHRSLMASKKPLTRRSFGGPIYMVFKATSKQTMLEPTFLMTK